MSDIGKSRTYAWSVVSIMIAAGVLRLWGITWGLPNALHGYSYHPDEFLTAGASINVIYSGSLNPHLFNYPSLYIYLCSLGYAIAFWIGMPATDFTMYFISRLISASLGTLAVWTVMWSARRAFGRTAALVAGVVLCLTPIHVQHAHFATVDVSSTLFVALALGLALRLYETFDLKSAVLAGTAAGLAAGTKYNACLVLVSVIAACWLSKDKQTPSKMRQTVVACVACVAAFLITTPGALLFFADFWHGLTYELRHTSSGHGLVFAGTGWGAIHTFVSSLWFGFGPVPSIAALLLAVYSLLNRDRRVMIVLVFAVVYYVLISFSNVRFARYTLPMLPALSILIGWGTAELFRLSRKCLPQKIVSYTILSTLIVTNAVYCIGLDGLLGGTDPRDSAAKWVFANVNNGSAIGTVDLPWFYSPPLGPMIGYGTLQTREAGLTNCAYRILPYKISSWDSGSLPEWAIITDYESDDALRLIGRSDIGSEANDEVNRTLSVLNVLSDAYVEQDVFARRMSVFGIDILDSRLLPHDMRYPSPTIKIYKRTR